jgi:hypothetical protein
MHLLIGLPLNRLLIPKAPPPSPQIVQADTSVEPRALGCNAHSGFRFRGHLVCHRRHGGAPAAPARDRRRDPSRSARGRSAGRPGAGRRANGRIQSASPDAPAGLGAVDDFVASTGRSLLALCGLGAVAAFAILHGAGNGLLTIAKGTLPRDFRCGWLPIGYRYSRCARPSSAGGGSVSIRTVDRSPRGSVRSPSRRRSRSQLLLAPGAARESCTSFCHRGSALGGRVQDVTTRNRVHSCLGGHTLRVIPQAAVLGRNKARRGWSYPRDAVVSASAAALLPRIWAT